jgi:hypothetical protein
MVARSAESRVMAVLTTVSAATAAVVVVTEALNASV